MYRPEPRSIISVRYFFKIQQHNENFDSLEVCKKPITQEVMPCFHILYEVTADRTPEVWGLIPRVGHEPLAFSCMSISTHSMSWHTKLWPKVMIIIITRLFAVDPLKLVIDTRLTQSIYAFFFADMPIKTHLLPRWTKSKDPFNGGWILLQWRLKFTL